MSTPTGAKSITTTPPANAVVNKIASAVSSPSRELRDTSRLPRPTINAATSAPAKALAGERPNRMMPMAMPGRRLCDNDPTCNADFRSTTNALR